MKDKVLKLCRRLKKCTLNDLVSLTEEKEDIVSTALLYLENKGCIEIKDDNIIYIDNGVLYGENTKIDNQYVMKKDTCELGYKLKDTKNNIVVDKKKTSVDEIMFPHMTSFTASGESESNTDSIINDDTNSNNSKKTDNEEKNNYDKQRYESNSKS